MRFCLSGLSETSAGYERTIGVSNQTPTMMEGLGIGFNSDCKTIHGLPAAPTGGLESSMEGAETERGDGYLHKLEGERGWSGIMCRFWDGQYAQPVRCVWDGLSHILVCGQPVNVDGPAHPRTSTRQTDSIVVANGAHAGHPSLAEGDANVDLMLSTPVKGSGSVLLQFA